MIRGTFHLDNLKPTAKVNHHATLCVFIIVGIEEKGRKWCNMSVEESDGVAATDNFAIGIAFGNSNSSIAYTSGVWSLLIWL